jgi:RHH-type proline utilization regulon transcriptional repressor/proline dehydrogenase/delta 1-pyrroline-5-carboxylate dehydrogenase
MIRGAMEVLTMGDPAEASTDIGPVIDAEARGLLDAHLEKMRSVAKVWQRDIGALKERGTFFGPAIVELASLDQIEKEVFGPILHVIRYDPDDIEMVGKALSDKGYGLTLGVHSRLEGFADRVKAAVRAGNVYVNRSIIGAVVGVQPFGGQGLSGTGPKAGGPHYLQRFATEQTVTMNSAAVGGNASLLSLRAD